MRSDCLKSKEVVRLRSTPESYKVQGRREEATPLPKYVKGAATPPQPTEECSTLVLFILQYKYCGYEHIRNRIRDISGSIRHR